MPEIHRIQGFSPEAAAKRSRRILSLAWKIPLGYLIAATAYILVSDAAVVRMVPAPGAQATVQSVKGLLFVLGTAGLLWLLLRASLRRLDRAARREDETRRTLLWIAEWMPAAVWTVGADERFVHWSRGAVELLGWAPDEARELTISDLAPRSPGRSAPASGSLCDAVKRRVPLRLHELELARKDGSLAVVGLTTAPLPTPAGGGQPDLLCVAVDLTPLKEATRRTRLTEHAVRTAPDPVFWLRYDGTFFFANESGLALLGRTERDLASLHVAHVLPDFPLDEAARATEAAPVSLEVTCRPGDGRTVPLWIAASRVEFEGERAICVFARDVSERWELEEALRQSERYYRSLIDHAPDSIAVVDSEGKLRFRNPATEHLTGRPDDEVLDGSVWPHVHPDDVTTLRESFRAALRRPSDPQRMDFRLRSRNGAWRTMEAIGTGFVDASGERCVIVHSRDVTEHRRHEHEVAVRAELSTWMAEAGAALTGRGELEAALRRCCEATADALDGVGCEIWIRDAAGGARRAAAAGPGSGSELRRDLDLQDTVLERVMRDGIRYTTNAAQQDSRIPEQTWLRENEFLAFSGTPLRIEGQVAGALALFARRPLGTAFADAARTLAHEISLAIHQRQAERELVEQRRVLQNVLSNIPQGVFWKDREGVFLGGSQRLADALGVTSPDDVIGRTDFDFMSRDQAEWYRSCDIDVMETGEPMLNFEEPIVGADGSVRSLLTSKVPLRNDAGRVIGVLGIFTDITELKEQQASIRRLAAAVDQVREGIVVTDSEGTIEYVNPAVQAITGYEVAELIGQNPRILSSGQMPAEHYTELWDTIRGGGTWNGRFINRRKDGSLYEEETTISPVRDEDGNIVQYVGVKRDISERTRMEAQLRQAQRLESIGALAAGIAHEINTPIQYVGDNVRFLQDSFRDLVGTIDAVAALARESRRDGPSPAALCDALEEALRRIGAAELSQDVPAAIEQTLAGVSQVTTIVRSMKEFAHPARDRRPTDLNRAVTNTVAIARNEWKHVAEVRFDLDPAAPCVEWVPAELNQVVLNLVVNAAQALAETRRETLGTITVRTRTDGKEARLEVADDGPGIPDEIRERIFDPFFTTKEPGKGTGQGLSIVHRLVVETYGGAIELASERGRGTTFTLRVPALAPDRVETA